MERKSERKREKRVESLCVLEREGEGDRQREIERQRNRERKTDRETERETDRQRTYDFFLALATFMVH